MNHAPHLIGLAALLMPAQAIGQAAAPAEPPPSERRLSPEQIEAVLAEAAKKREASTVGLNPDIALQAPRPQVHGEVGFSIGTGGYREVFGTAIYPLGDDGIAAISFDFVDLGQRRYRR